jgi:pyrroloquinoline quinone (PQQ) biosynthesis protein C
VNFAVEKMEASVARVFEQCNPLTEPMMDAISKDALSLPDYQLAALQTLHVVRFFPRFLAALLSNIDDMTVRMPVLENLLEEHGHLDATKSHLVFYQQFLQIVGVDAQEQLESKPEAFVIAYNRGVLDLCSRYHWCEGLAALSVIEEIVAMVSSIIQELAIKKIPAAGKEKFFGSHSELDIGHAKDMRAALAPFYESHKCEIERGFQLGAYYHTRFYEDLWKKISKKRLGEN